MKIYLGDLFRSHLSTRWTGKSCVMSRLDMYKGGTYYYSIRTFDGIVRPKGKNIKFTRNNFNKVIKNL